MHPLKEFQEVEEARFEKKWYIQGRGGEKDSDFWYYQATNGDDPFHAIKQYMDARDSRLLALLREQVEGISTVGMGAIPETDEYANGWNDCRQEYFSRKFKPFRDAILSLLEEPKE